MKRWLIPLAGLALALTTAGIVTAFALTGDGSSTPESELAGTQEPDLQGDRSTIEPLPLPPGSSQDPNGSIAITPDGQTSVIAPPDTTLTDGEQVVLPNPPDEGAPPSIPPDIEPIQLADEPSPAQEPVRSDEGISPDDSSLVHNVPTDIVGDEFDVVFSLAREDLSQRLDLDVNSIKLGDITREEWPDTSLGNPQPGIFYAQVIVPGFKLLLEDIAEGQLYTYHTSLDRVEFIS